MSATNQWDAAAVPATRALFAPEKVVMALRALHEPGSVFEVRALGVRMRGRNYRAYKAVSGFFDSAEAVARELERVESAMGIYVTLNPVEPALLNRAINRINEDAGGDFAAKDTDIVHRRWLLVDCDPKRPKGISATDAELQKGKDKARAIHSFLKERGWPAPMAAMSGNGAHLLYRVDLPPDDGELLKRVLLVLSCRFDGDGVDIDRSVHNPSRICKLYGTLACKGDHSAERPHRMSQVVRLPQAVGIVSREQLEALAAEADGEAKRSEAAPVAEASRADPLVVSAPGARDWDPHAFVEGFVAKHGIQVARKENKGGDTYYMLEACPWAAEHGGADKAGDAAIVVAADGQLGYHCFHSHCASRHWADFRRRYEPDYEQRRVRDWSPPPQPVMAGGDPEQMALQAEYFKILNAKGLDTNEKHKRMAAATIGALNRRGKFYYHSELRDYATAMWFDERQRLLLCLSSDEWTAWLSEWTGINRAERGFAYVQAEVETETLAGKATTGIVPAEYWASKGDIVYLSNGDGEIVRVSAGKVEQVVNGTDGVLFAASRTLAPWRMTEPADPFDTCRLFRECATTEGGQEIVRLHMLSLPTGQRCKPPLVLTGPVGSGKTRLAVGICELYGLPPRILAVTENGEDEFWTQLNVGGLVCFDNADTRTKWLPDALAAASTDGTHEKRQLYTDNRIVAQHARAWAVVTSANPTFAADAGLADRLLVVRLERRDIETEESALSDEIMAKRDSGLSWIAWTLAAALADKGPVPGALNRRHPDWAATAVRMGRAMGREEQAIRAIRSAEQDKSLFNVQNDDMGATLLEIVAEQGQWSGTAAELLDSVIAKDPGLEGKLTAKRLAKLWPHLETVLQAKRETGQHRTVTYSFSKPDECDEFEGAVSLKLPHEEIYRTLGGSAPRNSSNSSPMPSTDAFGDDLDDSCGKGAGFAGFQTAFPFKSREEESHVGLSENPSRNTANPAPSTSDTPKEAPVAANGDPDGFSVEQSSDVRLPVPAAPPAPESGSSLAANAPGDPGPAAAIRCRTAVMSTADMPGAVEIGGIRCLFPKEDPDGGTPPTAPTDGFRDNPDDSRPLPAP